LEHLQVVAGIDDEFLKGLKHYQTMMGNIQDNSVLFQLLSDFSQKQTNIPGKAYQPVLQAIQNEGYDLIDEFMKNIDMVYDFWSKKNHRNI
jgi:hypothetical protein